MLRRRKQFFQPIRVRKTFRSYKQLRMFKFQSPWKIKAFFSLLAQSTKVILSVMTDQSTENFTTDNTKHRLTSKPIISHNLLAAGMCSVIMKMVSDVFVTLLNTVSVLLVVSISPSQERPYDDVKATRNELVTTPATFRNSKILYHIPEGQNKIVLSKFYISVG